MGDCGYEAAMWAAGITPTRHKIRELRRRVAKELYEARVSNQSIAGITVHDILKKEGLTLASYCAKVEQGLWASIWEVHLSAKILGVNIMYEDASVRCVVGMQERKPKYAIRLKNKHYVVTKIHVAKTEKGRSKCLRGGMRTDWTSWQDDMVDDTGGTYNVPTLDLLDIEPHDDPPREQPSRARSTGHIEEHLEEHVKEVEGDGVENYVYHVDLKYLHGDIKYVKLEYVKELCVAELKCKVEDMTRVKCDTIDIMQEDDSDEELPDWVQVPKHVVVKMRDHCIPTVRLNVLATARGASFQIEVTPYACLPELKAMIAKVMGQHENYIEIVNDRGNTWTDLMLTSGMSVHVHELVQRGGVRTQISPTVPYESEDEELEEANWNYQVEGAADAEPPPRVRGRASDSSRSRSPMSSLQRASASPTRHAWHSDATPEIEMRGQHEHTPRVVFDRHLPVGYVLG